MEALAVLTALTMAMETRLEADLRCLPPPEIVKLSLAFYHAHDAWLDYIGLFGNHREVQAWQEENDSYGRVWGSLFAAQDASRPLEFRLCKVQSVKRQLGLPAFYRGQMPLPPIKHFKEGQPVKQQMDFLSLLLGNDYLFPAS
jgi:hypothetical protein